MTTPAPAADNKTQALAAIVAEAVHTKLATQLAEMQAEIHALVAQVTLLEGAIATSVAKKGARAAASASDDKFPTNTRLWFIRECSTNEHFIAAYIDHNMEELKKNAKLAKLPQTTPEQVITWRRRAAEIVWTGIDAATRKGAFNALYIAARDEFARTAAAPQLGADAGPADAAAEAAAASDEPY
jgi:hypothetical protein